METKIEPRLPESTRREVALIKKYFKDNDATLQLVRALFLGLDTTPDERKMLRDMFADEELRNVFHRRFLPQLSRETPVGQVQDNWLGSETNIFGQNETTILQTIQHRANVIRMTETALNLMTNVDGAAPDISYDANVAVDQFGIGLLSRNQYIRHIESQLLALKTVASVPDDNSDVAKKRTAKDSAK